MNEKVRSLTQDGVVMEGMVSFRGVVAGAESGVSDRRILRVLLDGSRMRHIGSHLRYIYAVSAEQGFPVETLTAEEIASASAGRTHGGVLTVCTGRTIPEITPEAVVPGGCWFYLEGIEDPYNFGSALRSLYAAGTDGVLLPDRNWMTAAPLIARASAGTSEMTRLCRTGDADFVRIFRERGYRIVCTDLPDSVSMWEADMKKPLLIVVGGEKRGISDRIMEQRDLTVRIDYGRDFRGALSAESACAVLAYEVLRRNRS